MLSRRLSASISDLESEISICEDEVESARQRYLSNEEAHKACKQDYLEYTRQGGVDGPTLRGFAEEMAACTTRGQTVLAELDAAKQRLRDLHDLKQYREDESFVLLRAKFPGVQ